MNKKNVKVHCFHTMKSSFSMQWVLVENYTLYTCLWPDYVHLSYLRAPFDFILFCYIYDVNGSWSGSWLCVCRLPSKTCYFELNISTQESDELSMDWKVTEAHQVTYWKSKEGSKSQWKYRIKDGNVHHIKMTGNHSRSMGSRELPIIIHLL